MRGLDRFPRCARGAALAASFFAASSLAQSPGGLLPSDEPHISLFQPGGTRSWIAESLYDEELQQGSVMLMYEVTHYPQAREPTPAQERAAAELVRRSKEAARENGWLEFEKALADGFELMYNDRVHYVNRSFVVDGRTLDPQRPEFLMYYDSEDGKRLVGYMYLVSSPEEHGPQVGGPLTLWHYHVWPRPMCLWKGLLLVGHPEDEASECEVGVKSRRSPEMMHVWFIDHPRGPFSTHMDLEPWMLGSHSHH